jgi:hypothetical protein
MKAEMKRMQLLLAGVLAASVAGPAGAAPAAAADDKDRAARDPWGTSVQVDLGARQLALGQGAPDRALARAAVVRSAKKLRLSAHGGLRLAFTANPSGRVEGARPVNRLRFRQTLGGLRVLWSDIDVAVGGDRVSSISARR